MILLIADDDKITRGGLVESLPWADFGIEAVLTAANGREALDILLHEPVDILITDIRMPYYTGFELVSLANGEGRYPATIIISGYDDYEYLQQAIKLEIILSYIFKPIDLGKLGNAVAEAVEYRKTWRRASLVPEIGRNESAMYMHKNYIEQITSNDLIFQAISAGDLQAAIDSFQANLGALSAGNRSLGLVKRYCWELVISLIHNIVRLGIDADLFYCADDPLTTIANLRSEEAIRRHVRSILEEAHALIRERRQDANPNVEYVRRAIEARFRDPSLTLKLLADELGVTPNYLGALYRRATDETFSAALTRYRLDVARELLRTTTRKVYQIALDVGYHDPRYFAAAFREGVGMTPKEYHNKYYQP